MSDPPLDPAWIIHRKSIFVVAGSHRGHRLMLPKGIQRGLKVEPLEIIEIYMNPIESLCLIRFQQNALKIPLPAHFQPIYPERTVDGHFHVWKDGVHLTLPAEVMSNLRLQARSKLSMAYSPSHRLLALSPTVLQREQLTALFKGKNGSAENG
ncbi:MAG: hypothetical protein ACE5OZ_07960 [Candidatus Heimdallarchaeota archaeon]